ncbi:MAG: CBS domain-containing protein [Dethiobacteria bacterium]|nr:CBS domain-containing protein [Bacillota bacterium]MDW7730187.1 CBS domain-containing protein [Bacillota bacterium]
MFVRDYMSCDPITIGPDETVGEALKLMEAHSIRRLPVMSHGKIAGLVTNFDLLKASPSPATSLSIHEINYLYPMIKIKDVMTKNVITINPDTVIEEAAVVMRENKIGTLLVEQKGKLLGVITESDLFKAFIDIFGFNYAGVRIAIEVEDDIGVLGKIAENISSLNINIISVIIIHTRDGGTNLILRLKTEDLKDVRSKLELNGYKLLD